MSTIKYFDVLYYLKNKKQRPNKKNNYLLVIASLAEVSTNKFDVTAVRIDSELVIKNPWLILTA